MIPFQSNNGFISEKTIRSANYFLNAKSVIPGGVSANIKYFSPHPIFMEKGNGSRLVDVDGNEYIDYLLCYGALLLGHGHPEVTSAVYNQLTSAGTAVFGAPHLLEAEMANKLIDYFPGIEMVRFTNSGLEATLLAIRLAQAYTGKTTIAKYEGHYHGGYNEVLLSVNPTIDEAGDEKRPKSVPESKGLSAHHVENTIILPFNDLDSTEHILRKNKDEIAAVIIEPVQGGFIPAEENFLDGVRKLTKDLGILLIFDEVKTGFRITLGGAQSIYGIKPDLTALGKVLGGGFPIGAVGGRQDIMEIMDPSKGGDILSAGGKASLKEQVLFHSGTYNGHPIVLAAGIATINVLEGINVYPELLQKTNNLRTDLEKLYHSYGVPMQTVGIGSIFNIVHANHKIRNYRDLVKADMDFRKKIDYELIKLGIYTKPLNRYSLSIVHTEVDIEETVRKHERAIKIVKGID
ncbi:aspartate aminotransferase family protein [Bacillus sp. REN16]|uniref:aspartate aminotransferase family protein n=1 Tax=Bacillus sp. REN16 TaxID=2887296 RepID=UPI001E294E6F|nr:aspartate aminotransferase family protein [Bacillus sp. REN16]MCC3355828.1 aspartate aminotransferase family protein [Bacillus sp. REN16]